MCKSKSTINSEKSKLFILLYVISILSIISIIAILINFNLYGITINTEIKPSINFPTDEGRHEEYNESWYFCFNLTDKKGNQYNFHTQYLISKQFKRCIRFCSFTDVSNKKYIYKQLKKPSDDYYIDDSKLNITYNHYSFTDNIFQIPKKPFTYHFSVGLSDWSRRQIILNCSLSGLKNPIIINKSLLNKYVFNDWENEIFYYIQSYLRVTGVLIIDGREISVSGSAWIDREWGQRIMARVEWFAIQLKNNYEISAAKVYNNQKSNSIGFLICPNGSVEDISEDLKIITLNRTKLGFSNKWVISSEKNLLNLTVTTSLDDQVIKTPPANSIFEGGCTISGSFIDSKITGFCFSEQNYKE